MFSKLNNIDNNFQTNIALRVFLTRNKYSLFTPARHISIIILYPQQNDCFQFLIISHFVQLTPGPCPKVVYCIYLQEFGKKWLRRMMMLLLLRNYTFTDWIQVSYLLSLSLSFVYWRTHAVILQETLLFARWKRIFIWISLHGWRWRWKEFWVGPYQDLWKKRQMVVEFIFRIWR